MFEPCNVWGFCVGWFIQKDLLLFCWHARPKIPVRRAFIQTQQYGTAWPGSCADRESRLSDLLKGTAAIQHLDENHERPVSTKWRHETPETCNLHSANVSLRVCSCNLKVNEKSNLNFTIENIPTSPSERCYDRRGSVTHSCTLYYSV